MSGQTHPFERSEKYIAARDSLPKHLHEFYRQLFAEYSFHTAAKYGRGYVAYEVLAELIRSGWRPQGPEAEQAD